MEFLKSVNDPLKKINDKNFKYLDIIKHPELVYGTTNKSSKVNFNKFPQNVRNESKKLHPKTAYLMDYHINSTSGCRIRFKTTSRKLIFKIKLKRGYNYDNMIMWNSSALTMYIVDDEENYDYHTVLAPMAGKNCFAEVINIPENSSVCIFLPTYDTIEEMYIGFQKDSRVFKYNYPKNKRLPIVFYGGSVAQGSSATKSGNSYPNIVSKKLNQDIINLSIARCCNATPSVPEYIGNINSDSIIIDYSRDATNREELENRHETFYKKIREKNPDKKIILMTAASFNQNKKYEGYDEVIIKTYENAVSRGEKTYLLNQKELFDEDDYELISFNNAYYTDYAMLKVAEKICELLNS